MRIFSHNQLNRAFDNNTKTRYGQDIYKISSKSIYYVYRDLLLSVMNFNEGLDKKIMDAIISLLLDSLEKYSKILMLRIDLHSYESLSDNRLITSFRKRFMAYLKMKFVSDVWFMWVREQTSSYANTHYHCFVILNHHKAFNNWSIKEAVDYAEYMEPNIWCWYPKANTYQIYRDDLPSLTRAVYRASYLAKNDTKEFTPQKIKRFQSSHLRH